MTECAGAVGTLADKRSKVTRRDENLMKKSKCQTLRRSADRENRFVLRLFITSIITSIRKRGNANEWKQGK